MHYMFVMCNSLSFNMSVSRSSMSELVFKKNEEEMDRVSQVEKKRRVLVLYTGGTIGMKWTDKGIIDKRLIDRNNRDWKLYRIQ